MKLRMNGAVILNGNEEQILWHIECCGDFLGGIASPDEFKHFFVLNENMRGYGVGFSFGFVSPAEKLDFFVGHSSCPFSMFWYLVMANLEPFPQKRTQNRIKKPNKNAEIG